MNMQNTTRVELYKLLKASSPGLAIGKTRAPRHELLRLLDLDLGPSFEVAAVVPETLVPSKPAKPRPRKKRLTAVVDKVAVFVPKISPEDSSRIRTGVGLLELAAQCISRSGMTASQIAHLLYITAGVNPVEGAKTIEGLLTLRSALEVS